MNGMKLSIYYTSLDSLTQAPASISLTEGEATALFVGAAVTFWDSAAGACMDNNVILIDKFICSLTPHLSHDYSFMKYDPQSVTPFPQEGNPNSKMKGQENDLLNT